jgi:hypothetical protein
MKNFTTLCALLLLTYSVTAQITVTQSDMPVAGAIVKLDSDLTPSVTPGSKGPSQVWNFAGLKASKTVDVNFYNTSSTPYASAFPASNIGDSVSGVYGFTLYSSSLSAFSLAGVTFVAGFPDNTTYTPLYTQLTLPANYLNTFGGSTIAIIPPISATYLFYDSAKGNVHITYADTIDAWGSMTTPAGTFNVLRKKHYDFEIDSLFLYNTNTSQWEYSTYSNPPTKYYSYTWYTNGIYYPLVQMNMDSTDKKVQNVAWYAAPLGINELSNSSSAKAYPDPCTTEINLVYSGQGESFVTIYDVTGRKISATEMQNGRLLLNTSSYSKGVYFYSIFDKTGSPLDRGKFSVQ